MKTIIKSFDNRVNCFPKNDVLIIIILVLFLKNKKNFYLLK